jgi:hypothetical protein
MHGGPASNTSQKPVNNLLLTVMKHTLTQFIWLFMASNLAEKLAVQDNVKKILI